jgi:hypothetical protein
MAECRRWHAFFATAANMLDTALLSSIATQMMNGTRVAVQGKSMPVRRTSSRRLRMVSFTMGGVE